MDLRALSLFRRRERRLASGLPPRSYRVFISYSHADTVWATWLLRRLETYRVPKRLQGLNAPIGAVGPRIAPVFLDRDELSTSADLGATIVDALRRSSALVVICSPAAARSRWVNEEILSFKRLGGGGRVFALVVDGVPGSTDLATECFPPALRHKLGPDGVLGTERAEPIAADARAVGDGRERACLRLLAGLLGVGYDELRRRELQRRHRRLATITTAAVLGMALTTGLAVNASRARDDAQRRQEQAEDLLTFMLGDLRTELAKVGRLSLLESVGEKAMRYFATLDPRDLSDTALARQAKALTQIGEIRMNEARYAAASTSFDEALRRAATLAERHPRDGELLFERGQAEYWNGFVRWRQGDRATARTWLLRYRDTCEALVALDPARLSWQRELSYGHHNLAVLDLESGDLGLARSEFEREVGVRQRLLAADPHDPELVYELSDTLSWLGTVAEREGDLRAAGERFREEARILASLVKAHPDTARWRVEQADALSFEAGVLAVTGQRDAARQRLAEARQVIDRLVALDPSNREWALVSFNLSLVDLTLRLDDSDAIAANARVEVTRASLAALADAEPTDPQYRARLAFAWRVEAQLKRVLAHPEAARCATQAVELGETLAANPACADAILGELGQAWAVAGEIAAHAGDQQTARAHWNAGYERLRGRMTGVRHWRLLDPWVRVTTLLGHAEPARESAALLTTQAYAPLEPWPDGAPAVADLATLTPASSP